MYFATHAIVDAIYAVFRKKSMRVYNKCAMILLLNIILNVPAEKFGLNYKVFLKMRMMMFGK